MKVQDYGVHHAHRSLKTTDTKANPQKYV